MEVADRLVASAVDAVQSFFSSSDSRFLRDTLDSRVDRLTTGGSAVAVELGELSTSLPYLKRVVDAPFDLLVSSRDAACKQIADRRYALDLHSELGDLNPYTASLSAYQSAWADPTSPRTLALGAIVLHHYSGGWPSLRNVEDPHPYVAQLLFRTVSLISRAGVVNGIRGITDEATSLQAVKAARVKPSDDVGAWLNELRSTTTEDDRAWERSFLETARLYLWQQHGFASTESSAFNALSYDPVGACFALQILVSAASPSIGGLTRTPITDFNDLIHLSVRHVLTGLTPSGSLAYGLPFSYSEKGMGAFATSISGLASLVQTLSAVFEEGRRTEYANAALLHQLLDDGLVDRLFSLPPPIEAMQRVRPDQTGWTTDRAPSHSRIEAWVTVDVLKFAAHLRVLIQEVAQFHVLQKYGAQKVKQEPVWPYDSSNPPAEGSVDPGTTLMIDPDSLGLGEDWDDSSPMRVTHEALVDVMRGNDQWKLGKSAFLLFGPPGTAKSTFVKSLAQSLGWHLLELTPSNFVESGLEMIEQKSQEIFQELSVLRETAILFDELDSLLTDREQLPATSILNFSVPAMLPKLQGLAKLAKKQRVAMFFATNFFDRLDPAMVRRGRMDERFVILPHNVPARERVLEHLCDDPLRPDAVSSTALSVYEDLKLYADTANSGGDPVASTAISPSLYFSRIPSANERRRMLRSSVRLAVEVAEVIGRLLDLPRSLSADSSREDTERRLIELRELLDNRPDLQPWNELCLELGEALIPGDPAPP